VAQAGWCGPARLPSVVDMDDRRNNRLRPALWALLILSLAANATLSGLDVNVFLSAAAGLVALACAAGLVAHHYRNR
jgi:hypothetical protein